jgi:3-dehydroquinate dehydratase type I
MQICTPIQSQRQKQVIAKWQALKGKTDCVEIWLDHIKDLDLQTLFATKPLPVVAVCKKPIEKGKFKGSYAEMASVLTQAGKNGADYIDIPLRIPEILNKKCIQECKRKSKIIISYHNFKNTPSTAHLLKKALQMKRLGADIVKIAVMAKSLSDTLRLIMLAQELQQTGIRHSCIAMGKKGTLSRVLTPFLGGTLMFAPLASGQATASGQLTVKQLRKAWSMIKSPQ